MNFLCVQDTECLRQEHTQASQHVEVEREFETASQTPSVFFPHLEERPRGSSSLGERL